MTKELMALGGIELLRMPLDAELEAVIIGRAFDRFDDTVGTSGDDSMPGTDLAHGLVMETVHVAAGGTEDACESAVGFDRDRVTELERGQLVVPGSRALAGEIDVESAASQAGEQLHPVADSEHWPTRVDRGARERAIEGELLLGDQIESQSFGGQRVESGVGGQVVAARQEQPVDLLDE
jgi:hypothetical protein